jgi:GGDEF domain-containing protein
MPSIGIALYPDHGEEAQQLLRYADEAMYFEKKNSHNLFANGAYAASAWNRHPE